MVTVTSGLRSASGPSSSESQRKSQKPQHGTQLHWALPQFLIYTHQIPTHSLQFWGKKTLIKSVLCVSNVNHIPCPNRT